MEYSGHRILEAMSYAPRYLDSVFRLARSYAPDYNQQILDFGAGDGAFVRRFQDVGYKVTCVEPDVKNQALLRCLNADVVTDVAELPEASFSYVYTINVLEHLPNLSESLAQLNRVLQRGGVIFAFVPAFNCLWTSLDDEVGHVQRFTISRLSSAFEQASLVVQSARYFDVLGFPAALGVRALESLGAFRYSPSSVGLYDKYLFPVSQMGDHVFSRLVGKNVILTATKQ